MNSVSATSATPTAYAINAKEFGPAAASAIGLAAGAAAVAANAVNSTVSITGEGLKRLSDFAGSAVATVENAVSGAGTELSAIGRDVEADVKKAYGAVSDTASNVVSNAEDFTSALGGDLASVASAAGDLVSFVKAEIV
jgi:phage-related protein